VFGPAATLWIGAAGMTVSVVPNLLSPLRGMRDLPTPENVAPAPSEAS
jgi:hypothetical protein